MSDDLFNTIYNKSLDLLSRREHSFKEIKEKLSARFENKEIIESVGASSIKDMGKIMGSLKQKYSDSIDFSKANIIIKGLLNQWNIQKSI